MRRRELLQIDLVLRSWVGVPAARYGDCSKLLPYFRGLRCCASTTTTIRENAGSGGFTEAGIPAVSAERRENPAKAGGRWLAGVGHTEAWHNGHGFSRLQAQTGRQDPRRRARHFST